LFILWVHSRQYIKGICLVLAVSVFKKKQTNILKGKEKKREWAWMLEGKKKRRKGKERKENFSNDDK
jgi:hypothetical protein